MGIGSIGRYYNTRTGDFFEALTQAVDAAFVGDTIAFDGVPFVKVSSRNRLDFI